MDYTFINHDRTGGSIKMIACYYGRSKKCKYLIINFGRTNLNQREEGPCYTCGKGKVNITRKLSDFPKSCNSRVLKALTQDEINPKENCLQKA